MTSTAADYVISFLLARGIRKVAGMPGGAALPLYDALGKSALEHVLVRHEQAAGFIAQGMARASGATGVCLATSGPGATNLLTALADAKMDSVPVLAITGQVPTSLIGTDAFQEIDIVAMAKPAVKHAEQVRRADELPAAIARCFSFTTDGRPGPVLLDIPKDVQQAPLDVPLDVQPHAAREPVAYEPSEAQLEDAAALFARAKRPVLYVGGGAIHAGAHELVAALARSQDAAVTCTLMGLGAFDPHDARALGMLGMHGAPYTNLLLRECDLLVAIGARFDDRATGKLSEFCPRAAVLHVDIDARELGKLRVPILGVRSDAARFLAALLPRLPARERPAWRERIASVRAEHPMPRVDGEAHHVLEVLAASMTPQVTLTTDVGQHQMWVAQHVPVRRPRQLLTSGGLGSMGFGLPAAIGAALQQRSPVWCVSGDGSILLNIHELATLAELALDVHVLVLDNQHLGLVRQQQTLFYGQRLSAAAFARSTDFVAVARAFGIEAVSLRGADAVRAELPERLRLRGPRLTHLPIGARELVLPMVAPGAGNHEMVCSAAR